MTRTKTRVPLCPEHFIKLKLGEVRTTVASSDQVDSTDVLRCTEPDCPWTYSRASGYFRFQPGDLIQSEQSLRHLCSVHQRPLYIAEYESIHETAVWECPDAECEIQLRDRMQLQAAKRAPEK